MLVFDTSAFINAWRDHLPPETFPSVWRVFDDALQDGRILMPREVLREVGAYDDDLNSWVTARQGRAVEPDEQVQRLAGEIQAEFPESAVRNAADAFIIAEARIRGFAVVTYEGRSFDGARTTRWERKMPGICAHFDIECLTVPQALARLGATI